jgi:transcriptional regulator of aromatic amino acid metabolism
MLQATGNEVDTHPLLILWLASQRPQQHFLLRCDPGRFDSVASQAAMFGTPPVRLRRFPGNLVLPNDKRGTLLLNDVDELSLPDQIGLYDWLGTGAGDLRVISIATSSLAQRVARGAFLEGLFHRLGAVQFDLRSGELTR